MLRAQPIDYKRPFIVARAFIFAGKSYEPGEPFPIEGVGRRLIERQFNARAIRQEQAPPAKRVAAKGKGKGRRRGRNPSKANTKNGPLGPAANPGGSDAATA
jgi:hypothetical protein